MSRYDVKTPIGQVQRDVRSLSPLGHGGKNGTGRSRSQSPVDDAVITANRVQNLIRAAEQYNSEQTTGRSSISKKRPSLPTESKYIPHERKLSHQESCRSQDQSPSRNDVHRFNRSFDKKSTSPVEWRKNLTPTGQQPPCKSTSSTQNSSCPINSLQKPDVNMNSKPVITINNKPVIPTKPSNLATAAMGPRKPSLTSSPQFQTSPSQSPSSSSAQSLLTPSSTPSSQGQSPSSQESASLPVYAQIDRGKTNHQNNDAMIESPSSEKHTSSSDIANRVLLRSNDGNRLRRDSAQYRESVFSTIYDNSAALTAAELFDSSWSDSDSYKDYSDIDVDEDGSKKHKEEKTEKPDVDESKATGNEDPQDKCFKIANELLKTEQDYVTMLHLIHGIFYTRLEEENKNQQLLPSEVLNHIFAHIKNIYLFHSNFLLPQLQERMKIWESSPKIGDLLKKNAPFLKMYSEYILNFPQAMELLKEWTVKSSRFSNIILEIQKDPSCGSLSLQHHMLGPIQRVPRYELLLKDYVKHLPEDSPDKLEGTEALDLVAKAASHSNEARRKIETFQKLLEIYQSLKGVSSDFISPTREYVMQGPITKISARSGEKQPRYIFLFSDLVLICSQYLLSTYNVRCQMQVENMEVKPGSNMHIVNTFMVHSKQKAVEFLDETTTPEPLEWEKKIGEVIEAYKSKKQTIKQDNMDPDLDNEIPDTHRGKVAPRWIPDDAATMCMLCGTSFNMMRRRHHCRSCGKLVCRSCCRKAPLEYMKGKIERVCAYCYDVIVNKIHECSSESSNGNSPKKKKGSKKVKASDPCLIAHYLQWSEDKGKTWQRLWVTAHTDFVLYSFKAHEDVQSVSVVPLPGYTVETSTSDPCWFALRHKKKYFSFQAEDEKKKKSWVAVLEKLVKAECPDETLRHSIKSDSSRNSSSSKPMAAAPSVGDLDNQSDTCENQDNDEKAEVKSLYDNVDP